MKAKVKATASKLLNLYRQAHVIVGGWTALNPIFVDEATDDVINELRDLPTGKNLVKHIENLRSGKTPMDGIERELLPYGGMMGDATPPIILTQAQWKELESGLEFFTPDQSGLNAFLTLDVVRSFGDEWPVAIRTVLSERPHLLDKWRVVKQTYNAYRLWDMAHEIIANPISDRARAQVQADMPEYEAYLPMFGDEGTELLGKLRTFISTAN